MLLQKSKGHFNLVWRKKKKEIDWDSLRASVNVDFLECTAVEPQTQSADFSLEHWRWRLLKTPCWLCKIHMTKIVLNTKQDILAKYQLDPEHAIRTIWIKQCWKIFAWSCWCQIKYSTLEIKRCLFCKVLLLGIARYTDDCWLQVYVS